MRWLTPVFILAVLASLAIELWLSQRQARAVERHRDQVPGPFAGSVSAGEHGKAADYTLAKLRLGRLGAVVDAALTLVLMAFGAGMGFSAISPWTGSGVAATTFSVGTGLYFIVIAMLASTIGGYLAGRLRTRWTAVHTDEVYFRDTAHGFMSWACAVVVSAAVLGAAGTAIVSGATAGLTQRSNADGGPAAIYVDELFRAAPTANTAAAPAAAVTAPTTAPAAAASSACVPRRWRRSAACTARPTARISIEPLNKGSTKNGAPSWLRPATVTASTATASTVPQTLTRPGRIEVAPRSAAVKAGNRYSWPTELWPTRNCD